MKRRRHDNDANEPLWKRVLGRYGFSGVAARPRVPLVLLRQRRMERIARAARTASRPPASASTLRVDLHVLLDWPGWLRPDGQRGTSSDRTAGGSGLRRSRELASRTGSPLAHTHRDSPSLHARAGQPASGHSSQATVPSTSIFPAATRQRATAPAGSIVDRGLSPRRVSRRPDSPRGPIMSDGRGMDTTHHAGGGDTPSISPRAGLRARTVASSVPRISAVRPPLSSRVLPHRDEARPLERWGVRIAPAHLRQPSPAGEAAHGVEPSLSRVLAKPPRVMAHPTQAPAEHEVRGPGRPTPAPQPSAPAAPPLDLARLSDEVYRHIQRTLRIERERRGL